MAQATKSINLDVPTAVRAGSISAVIAIVVIIATNFFDATQIDYIIRTLVYILAGILYMRFLPNAELSYKDAAIGGAVSGAITGFVLIVGGALLDASLAGVLPYTAGLGGLSQSTFASALLEAVLAGALLGALGAAWSIFMRTQRIAQ